MRRRRVGASGKLVEPEAKERGSPLDGLLDFQKLRTRAREAVMDQKRFEGL